MTTRQFSYAVKSKLPGGLCLIIIGTEGDGTLFILKFPLIAAPEAPVDRIQPKAAE
jgi:hypothetical protein